MPNCIEVNEFSNFDYLLNPNSLEFKNLKIDNTKPYKIIFTITCNNTDCFDIYFKNSDLLQPDSGGKLLPVSNCIAIVNLGDGTPEFAIYPVGEYRRLVKVPLGRTISINLIKTSGSDIKDEVFQGYIVVTPCPTENPTPTPTFTPTPTPTPTESPIATPEYTPFPTPSPTPSPSPSPSPTASPTPSPSPTPTPTPTPTQNPDYVKSVAYDLCGPKEPCLNNPVPVEAALTCTPIGDFKKGGFPRAGGTIYFQLYSDPSKSVPEIPSLNFWKTMEVMVGFCAASPPENQEPDPTKWSTLTSIFYGRGNELGGQAIFRAYGQLTVAAKDKINVTIIAESLRKTDAGQQYWANWFTVTKQLVLATPYKLIEGMVFKLPNTYDKMTASYAGGQGNITHIRIGAIIMPLIHRCGSTTTKDRCGMWNGSHFVMCFRGLIIDTTNEVFPKPFVCGINRSECGGIGKSICGCDECEAVSSSYNKCDLNKDPSFLSEWVNTGFEPLLEKQQIQVGADTGKLKVMVKSIQGVKYFMWKEANAPTSAPWAKSTGAEIDGFYSPTIYFASDPAFPRWQIYFYVVKYPSDEIVPDCTKYYGFAGDIDLDTTKFNKVDEQILDRISNHEKNTIETSLNINVGYNRKEKLNDLKRRISIPCIHLGDAIQEENSCNCVKTQKHKCKIFGECRKMGPQTGKINICTECKYYTPPENT